MTYSTGPDREGMWRQLFERAPAEGPATPGDTPRQIPKPPPRPPAGGDGHPRTYRVLWWNDVRAEALEADDRRLAREARREVVAGLSAMLDVAATRLAESDGFWVRGRVRKLVKRDLAGSTFAALRLDEVTGPLDLPPEPVEGVLESLRTRGAADPAIRDEALRAIEARRADLRTVAEDDDHPLLDEVMPGVLRIFEVLMVAAAAAMVDTLTVGELPVAAEVAAAALTAIAAGALRAGDAMTGPAGDAVAAARAALTELRSALAAFTASARRDEAHQQRLRLLVRAYAAQNSLVGTRWPEKVAYWNTLGTLTTHVGRTAVVNLDTLARLANRLSTVTIPDDRG